MSIASTHTHEIVIYALAPFKRKLVLVDGRTLTREFKAGDVPYSNGETHIDENIGATPTEIIMVEMKSASNGADARC